MLVPTLVYLFIFLMTFTSFSHAGGPQWVSVPPEANECAPFHLAWSGGTQPFIVSVCPPGFCTNSAPLELYSNIFASTFDWTLDQVAYYTLAFLVGNPEVINGQRTGVAQISTEVPVIPPGLDLACGATSTPASMTTTSSSSSGPTSSRASPSPTSSHATASSTPTSQRSTSPTSASSSPTSVPPSSTASKTVTSAPASTTSSESHPGPVLDSGTIVGIVSGIILAMLASIAIYFAVNTDRRLMVANEWHERTAQFNARMVAFVEGLRGGGAQAVQPGQNAPPPNPRQNARQPRGAVQGGDHEMGNRGAGLIDAA